jgi:hypothetical protein
LIKITGAAPRSTVVVIDGVGVTGELVGVGDWSLVGGGVWVGCREGVISSCVPCEVAVKVGLAVHVVGVIVSLGNGEGLRSGLELGEISSVGVSEASGTREGVKLSVRLREGVSAGVLVPVILGD